PLTGQPDFADIHIEYIADKFCGSSPCNFPAGVVREGRKIPHEAVTPGAPSSPTRTMDPRFIRLKAVFNVRGGVYTNVECEHRKEGWSPREVVSL
ncbi:NADPH-dependent 7-cyano-7-deazaguanine reductase QueF, partial [Candidatus Pseudothioglobus singularis]|uniref:NADPH-dependent 7-cyano-7-deazaguanine reductase QueF n=1 Tax=Candidatus Pseudothioglobus singularis TaxID=1427364 RepID=UPI0020764858